MCFKHSLLQVAQASAGASIWKPSTNEYMHTQLTLLSLSAKKNIKSMLLRNQGAEVGFSHFQPCLAHVFLQGRVERCSPGHFIITVRKDSMKLSQGSKEGCFHKIPLPLLSKHALFYILQAEGAFSFDASVTFILCPIWVLRCLGLFFVLSVYTYIFWFFTLLYVKSSIFALQGRTGSKWNQVPIFILSNELLAKDLDLLS